MEDASGGRPGRGASAAADGGSRFALGSHTFQNHPGRGFLELERGKQPEIDEMVASTQARITTGAMVVLRGSVRFTGSWLAAC